MSAEAAHRLYCWRITLVIADHIRIVLLVSGVFTLLPIVVFLFPTARAQALVRNRGARGGRRPVHAALELAGAEPRSAIDLRRVAPRAACSVDVGCRIREGRADRLDRGRLEKAHIRPACAQSSSSIQPSCRSTPSTSFICFESAPGLGTRAGARPPIRRARPLQASEPSQSMSAVPPRWRGKVLTDMHRGEGLMLRKGVRELLLRREKKPLHEGRVAGAALTNEAPGYRSSLACGRLRRLKPVRWCSHGSGTSRSRSICALCHVCASSLRIMRAHSGSCRPGDSEHRNFA